MLEVRVKGFRQFPILLLALAFVLAAAGVDAQQVDPKTYGGMKWLLIGPFRGGRVVTVTGVPSQPNTYYFGAVGPLSRFTSHFLLAVTPTLPTLCYDEECNARINHEISHHH